MVGVRFPAAVTRTVSPGRTTGGASGLGRRTRSYAATAKVNRFSILGRPLSLAFLSSA